MRTQRLRVVTWLAPSLRIWLWQSTTQPQVSNPSLVLHHAVSQKESLHNLQNIICCGQICKAPRTRSWDLRDPLPHFLYPKECRWVALLLSLPILESLVWIFLFTMNICMRPKIYVWLQEKLCHVTSGFVIWANNSVQSIMYCFG